MYTSCQLVFSKVNQDTVKFKFKKKYILKILEYIQIQEALPREELSVELI